MRLTGVFVVLAVLAVVVALLVSGAFSGQPAATTDTAEMLAGAGDLFEAVASNNVEFVRQVYIWSTWSNGVYLVQTMPYTVMSVAGAILAIGLALYLRRDRHG